MKINTNAPSQAQKKQPTQNSPMRATVEQERGSTTPENAQSATQANKNDNAQGDIVELSLEATRRANEKKGELQKLSDDLKWLQEQMEVERKQSAAAAKAWKTLITCMKIAMRIMSGDRVPRADHRFLAKNEPEMYARAITLRKNKEYPKKLKRLSEKEKPDDDNKAGEPKDQTPAIPGSSNDDQPADPAIPGADDETPEES